MNFLGGNEQQGPTALTVAKVEADVLTDLFTKLSQSCNSKCIVAKSTGEADLTVGEMSCVDRCVGKYMQCQMVVGNVLNDFEKQMKAQEEIKQRTEAAFGVRK